MRRQFALNLALLLLVDSAAARDVGDDPAKIIFILAGQSNMAGRGGVSGDRWNHRVPPACAANPRILRLSSRLYWEPAREPLHYDIDTAKTCGVGPGMAFANAVQPTLRGGDVIGLVPCAVGGTRIAEWQRGRPLYDALLRRARAAVASGGGRVGALLWYQGESDTVRQVDAEVYGARMQRMIRDVREDLGMSELLVIQVALASGEGNYTEVVREAQRSMDVPNVICVDAKGLTLEEDHLHLTTDAQVQLGKMMAAAYLQHSALYLDHIPPT